MTTLAQAWNDYRAICVRPKSSWIQLRAYQRTFYAGAEALMAMILRGGLEPPFEQPLDPDHITAYICTLCEELEQHRRDLAGGSA